MWNALPEATQAGLLRTAGVTARTLPATGTDAELLAALQAQDLAAWQTQTDALPTRCAQALAAAIEEAEPKATRVSLRNATLRNQAEQEDWLEQVRADIEAALNDGPVIV